MIYLLVFASKFFVPLLKLLKSVDHFVLCTPVITATIRNPGYRPTYSWCHIRPMSECLGTYMCHASSAVRTYLNKWKKPPVPILQGRKVSALPPSLPTQAARMRDKGRTLPTLRRLLGKWNDCRIWRFSPAIVSLHKSCGLSFPLTQLYFITWLWLYIRSLDFARGFHLSILHFIT